MRTLQFRIVVILVLFLTAPTGPVFALPQGEKVVAGQASFERPDNGSLNVHQHSDKMIADYQSFSIGKNESVRFLQPSSSSVALNRVVGIDPSEIMGNLSANGRVFLINPNGVVFGQTARVDTAGLLASTLDISNEDFLAGRYQFSGDGKDVINRGIISVGPGGYVALLGNRVENSGAIEARLGSVALASGKAATVELDPKGLISIVVNRPSENVQSGQAAVANSGSINAEGGRVILTSNSLNGVIRNSVNNSGIITANSLVERNGEIFLTSGGDNSSVVNTGTVDASASEAGANGGFIEFSAEHLDLARGTMDASSVSGKPGTILLDPDFFTIDDAWADIFADHNGSNIVVEADLDVNFQLSGGLLDFTNFDTETFIVHAGRDINQNGNTIVTHGGNVSLLSDTGNINLNAPIRTHGGDVDIQATEGQVVHLSGASVTTQGGHFRGKSGGDYIVDNGVTIDSGNGILDIFAGNNLILGTPQGSSLTNFRITYLSAERSYHFLEFGYYFKLGGEIVYVPLLKGPDIGRDGVTPLGGSFSVSQTNPAGYYTVFTDTKDVWHYHTDPTLNEFNLNHVLIDGIKYSWEDIYGLGDRDFNDVVMNIEKSNATAAPGATLKSGTNMFLTADRGFIRQVDGLIQADNLALSSNKGMTGTDPNGGLITDVNKISALNKTSGDIIISNRKGFAVGNLSGLTGLNAGVRGRDGITNNAPGGKITAAANGNLLIDAPIAGKGNIELTAQGDIVHTSRGNITIDNDVDPVVGPPKNVTSPSHDTSTWTNDNTIDVTWQLPDPTLGCCGSYTASATGKYTMAIGSKVVTDSGNATITAGGDIALSFVDAGNGNARITSTAGSIMDNDLGTAPGDYDVIAHNIKLQAAQGSVGGSGAGQEIDTGYPLAFSYLFDLIPNTSPNNGADAVNASLNANGDWIFSTSFTTPVDSDSWWFHVKTVDEFRGLSSSSVHLGPFWIDTIAPVISASYEDPNQYGWYNHDVTVNFNATDERSGFLPGGSLTTILPSGKTTTEGRGLTLTSGIIRDRAGNEAVPVRVSLNVDKTAPVIHPGTPQGTHGPDGTFTSDVTVPFDATDNLSGFAPDGDLEKELDPKTTTGRGNVSVTSDGVSDMAGNFAPGVPAAVRVIEPTEPPVEPPVTPPVLPPGSFAPRVLDNIFDAYRAYYEILEPSQFLSFEPATKIGLYAYHPITETDSSAFQGFTLDAGAYEFIENNIRLKKEMPAYYP
ncbi:MAG: filamentous hemagglutinin N-terminal domain-containing protein [Candidatus Omnitrophica bacterium]|nr:filamentous hemagglutinin N-terminal domain-containing protein [Candidatus Omnitrophota bacterium]